MAFKIDTFPLCMGETIGASGTAGTFLSDVIDLRDFMAQGQCGLTQYRQAASGATCGSSVIQYQICATRNGTFIEAGTFGTHGATPANHVNSFTPIVAPFMKVKCVTGTSAPLVLTAELHVL